MDKLDRAIKQKKFFKIVYGDLIGEGGNLKDNQYIRVFQNKDDFSKIEFFNNVDDLVNYTSNRGYINTYFTLSTTNGESGQEKDLIYRSVLGFDFDKKDLGENFSYKDIIERFKSLGIWYHALIDSGHGFHVYMCVEPTQDLHKVQEVQKALGKLLGADLNALKSTQVLRVPYSHNTKKDKAKRVNIIKMFPKDTIKRYDVNKLYDRFCCNAKDKEIGNRATEFIINNTNIPKCIQDILNNGSSEGSRYEDLQKIVVILRQRNKSLNEIKQVCKEWANKSNYSDNLDYRIDNIYNNLNYVSMDCKGCNHKAECFNVVISDFDFKGYEVFTLENKIAKNLKTSKRGVKSVNGNELLIINVLKNNNDGLYKSEIVKKITYKNKCRLSEPTLIKTLKDLENKNLINVKKGNKRAGIENFYTINPIRCNIDNTLNISYLATSMCICRLITPTELALYHYMRYLHHEQQKTNKGLGGNLFQFNQKELAKGFYGKDTTENQGNISKMIKNLLECHILDIWERQVSKNNSFEYYIYRLNS